MIYYNIYISFISFFLFDSVYVRVVDVNFFFLYGQFIFEVFIDFDLCLFKWFWDVRSNKYMIFLWGTKYRN